MAQPSGLPEVRRSGARLADSAADVVVVGVRLVDGKPVTGTDAAGLCDALGLDLALLVERASSPGKAAEIVDITVGRRDCPVERVLLVGVGDGSPRGSDADNARRVPNNTSV